MARTSQRMIDGQALMVDGAMAISDDCCCGVCPEPGSCGSCDSSLSMVSSGFSTSLLCVADAAALNTTITLNQSPSNCLYSGSDPIPPNPVFGDTYATSVLQCAGDFDGWTLTISSYRFSLTSWFLIFVVRSESGDYSACPYKGTYDNFYLVFKDPVCIGIDTFGTAVVS